MNPELTTQLYERYPRIFERRPLIECGDGWFDLLDKLCGSLQTETKNGGPQVIAARVREKFGELRFGSTIARNDAQRGMIELARTFSSRICEVCGDSGKMLGPGWCRTRCDAHVNDGLVPYDWLSLATSVDPSISSHAPTDRQWTQARRRVKDVIDGPNHDIDKIIADVLKGGKPSAPLKAEFPLLTRNDLAQRVVAAVRVAMGGKWPEPASEKGSAE